MINPPPFDMVPVAVDNSLAWTRLIADGRPDAAGEFSRRMLPDVPGLSAWLAAAAANRACSATAVLVGALGTALSRYAGEPLLAQGTARARAALLARAVAVTDALADAVADAEGFTIALDPGDDDTAGDIGALVDAQARTAGQSDLTAPIVFDVVDLDAPETARGPDGQLTLALRRVNTDWTVELIVAANAMQADTFDALANALQCLLTHAVAAPHTPLYRLPLVAGAARQQVLERWNATVVPRVATELAHHPLEQLAATAPDTVVAEYEGATISAQALNWRANALAASLIDSGVTPGTPVALAMERSFDLLVALFGVLKAGAVFVPIDPELPPDRIAYLLADAGAEHLLTQPHLVSLVRNPATMSNCDILALPPVDARKVAAVANPVVRVLPTDAAYILYTSGSTGRPKGVRMPHRALANHARWFGEYLRMSADDRVLQYASVSFDASLAELFAPITARARIVLAPAHAHRDLLGLADLVHREAITIMLAVPSVARAALAAGAWLTAAGAPPVAPRLRHVALGGEAIDHELVRTLQQRLPAATIGNYYGPTEACIDSLTTDITDELMARPRLPIGRPVANARAHVLDRLMQPLPQGAVGDLYIGGVGLAEGYHRQPALTAKRFVDDPFRPGERLYLTGDRARYTPAGDLEFHGRSDGQVKMRGFRIELSEIETAVRLFAGVQDAAAVACPDVTGDPMLVAWIVADTPPALPAVLSYLRQTLPAYAVPARIGLIDVLPMTTSGKLDRRALAARPLPPLLVDETPVRPPVDDPIALRLLPLWERALGVSPIGLDDSFFSLGGHSLKAIHLLNEIEQEFGVDVRGAVFFEAPTVRALAERLRTRDPRPRSPLIPVQPRGSRTPLFVVPGAGGELFGFELIAQALGRDHPFYLLDLYGFDTDPALADTPSLPDIVATVIPEVRRIQPAGPYQFAGYSLGGNIALELARQLREQGEVVGQVILLDVDGPGYPILEPLPTRLVTHVRHALQLGPRDGLRYVRQRLPRLARQLGGKPREDHRLFTQVPGADVLPAAVVQRMEAAFAPLLAAWERHVPAPYDGPVTLVRAQTRQVMVGVRDDDPLLGWGAYLSRITVDALPCGHFDLLLAPNSARLAETLERHLLP